VRRLRTPLRSLGAHGSPHSLATGAVFLAGFAGIASGNQVGWLNLAFCATVVTSWVWSRPSVRMRRPAKGFLLGDAHLSIVVDAEAQLIPVV
jgi:hypothetical protein